MKSTRSSLASRYSVAFILCLSCLMILMASALSVSPSSSSASSTPSSARVGATALPAGGPITRTMASPTPLPPVGPALTATKTDNTNVAVNPGDTIMYTVMINSTGTTDALNVIFTDTIDPNTTLVPGSVKSSPIAFDDTYTASGNIPIAPAASVLVNDIDPDTGTNAGLTVTQVQGAAGNVGNPTNTTATGIGGVAGSVTLFVDGSFTYEPPPGFTGADTFTYQISDASLKTGSGTVTINISNMVWFIDNTSAAANSRGTFSQPFKTIAAFNAVNTGAAPNPQNGHHVVIRPASGSYAEADGINLRDSQTLTGPAVAFNTVFSANANSTSAYNTFAASTGTAAAITATAGNGVDLGSGNALRGFNIGNTPGNFGVNGAAVGALTVATVSKTGTGGAMSVSTSGTFGATVNFGTFESGSSATSNLNLVGVTGTLGVTSGGAGFTGSAAANAAINISAGSVSMTYPGNVTKASTGALLSVAAAHTGTLTFNTGTLNASSGTGLQFDNADGTYNFNGTTTLAGGDAGVDILNGSSGTFSFSSSTTITNPTGTAFNVNNSSPSVTYSGSIGQTTSGQRVVNIDTTASNTITFQTGTITGGPNSTGININAANGNITFSNGMTLGTSGSRMVNQAVTINTGSSAATYDLGVVSIFTTGAAAQGIAATNFDGVLNATGTVDASGASAINIAGPGGITTLTMSFTKVSTSGGTNGIKLTNCGGSFTITGDGGGSNNGSGGTISTATAEGILINVASNVTLGYLNITTSGTDGINTTGVNGFTLNRCNVTDSAGGAADDGVALTNTSGTVTISNCVITSSPHNGVTVDNNNTNMAGFNFTNTTVSCAAGAPCQPSGSIGNDGLSLSMRGTSVLPNGLVSGSSFSGVRGVGVQIETNDTGRIGVNSGAPTVVALDTTNSFTVQNNTFTGNGQGIDINTSQVSNLTFQDLSNTITGIPTASGGNGSATAINAFTAAGASTGPAIHSFVGNIDGNIIGTQGTKDSGSGFGNGIRVVVQGQTTQGNITVNNNTVRECPIANPLNFIGQNGAAASGSATAHFKITNNTLPLPSGTNVDVCGTNTVCIDAGIFILADEGTPVCNVITGNNVFDANAFNGTFDIYLAERAGPPAGAQLTVEGTGGSNSAYLIANNTLAGTHQFLDEGANTSQVALGTCGTFPNLPDEAKTMSAAHPPQSDGQEAQVPTTGEALTVVRTLQPEEQEARRLSPADLNWMIEAAITRWQQAGISGDDIARLRGASFEFASLPNHQLSSASGTHIKIDETAAGYGWFFDQTPLEDSEFDVEVFGKERQTSDLSPAHGRVDLLTVLVRELGSIYLQGKDRIPKKLRPLMETTLAPAVRRMPEFNVPVRSTSSVVPAKPSTDSSVAKANAPADTGTPPDTGESAATLPGEARYAVFNPAADQASGITGRRPTPAMMTMKNGSANISRANRARRVGSASPFSGETVTVNGSGGGFTIPVGKSITIMFSVTVNAANTFPPGTVQVCNQGFVSATGIASFGTTDPGPPVVNGPTCTALNVADVSVTKAAGSGTTCSTSNIVYTIGYHNGGPANALAVVVSDPMPAGTSLVSAPAPANWSRTDSVPVGGNGTIMFSRTGASTNGESQNFTVTVSIDGTVTDGSVLSNTASVTSTTPDPNLSNNTSSPVTMVTVKKPPTTATVGLAQTICALGTTTSLGGNTPTIGTGTWTVQSGGTGTFNPNATTPGATFTHLTGVGPVVLRWTISNPPCTDSFAEVTVTVRAQPTATVGPAQTICALGTTTTLGGNTPTPPATGMWSIVTAGVVGTFNPNATTPGATFTHTSGAIGSTVTLRWTVSNAPCTDATADIVITIKSQPTATVGGPQTICSGGTTASLGGNTPPVGATGTWSIVTAGVVGTFNPNATTPGATFTHTSGGSPSFVLRWTVSNAPCTAATADVTITLQPAPISTNGGPQTVCQNGTTAGLGGNTPIAGETGTWSIVTGGATGTFAPNATTPNATFSPTSGAGTITLRWTVNNATCGASATSDVIVTVKLQPTATVGGPQTICALGTTASLGGNTPAGGATGTWSIVTAGSTGTFNPNATTPGATFTHLTGAGPITLRWTVSNAPCANATADVVITINQPPTTATVGGPQTICAGSTTASLGGNTPISGTGLWTIQTGGATGTFNPNASTPGATFTPTSGAGVIVVRWTISNPPCTASFAEVTITVKQQPTATVGGPQTICALGTTASLGGNTPAGGATGTWTIVTAGATGTFNPNASSPTATFTHATGAGPITLRWTVSNPPCSDATADVVITITQAPTTATVGGPQTICALSTTAGLGGNTPASGTGTWTVQSGGAGTFNPNASTPNATFTHTSGAGPIVLRWTIANPPCASSFAEVTITITQSPTTATVGGPQTICALSTTAGLGGNTPASGTGTWTVQSGGAGTFNPNASTPNATFTHTSGAGPIVLRWTIANPPCASSFAEVTITITQPPTTATVGGPQTICALSTTAGLGGNTPAIGTGTWTVQSGGAGTFNPNAGTPNATFTHTSGAGPIVLRWTIANAPCPSSFAEVTVTIVQGPTPATVGGPQTICQGSATAGLGGNTPGSGTGTWTIQGAGTGTFNPNANTGNATFTPTSGAGTYTLRWTIANPPCANSFAEVTVTVKLQPTATTGGPQTICALSTTASLGGNTPAGGATGMWTIVSGGSGTFNPNATTPGATFTHTGGLGPITLRWTVSNPPCPNATADVVLTIKQPPTTATVGPNQTISPNTTTAPLGGNVPASGTGMWSIVTAGFTGTFNPDASTANATWTHLTGSGQVKLRWTISNPPCADSFAEVTIQIGVPPTITCPASPIVVGSDSGQCSASVTFTVTATGIPSPTVVCKVGATVITSPHTFPVGSTTVTCTASNGVAPDATCSFVVTVNDTQPPNITCPPNVTKPTDPNLCSAVVNYQQPTVSDNCSGVGIPMCSPASGSIFQKGTTTVTCTVKDSANNMSMCTFTVTVNDTQAPSITCPANITTQCPGMITYPPPTVGDNCPGVGMPVCSPTSGSMFPKGTTTVTCTVKDSSNNMSMCSFTVTVNDTQPPMITCPNNIIVAAAAACPPATSTPVNFTVTAIDNCLEVTVVCKNQNGVVVTSGQPFPVGTTTVTCTAVDASSNTATCSFTVTVFTACLVDETNPGNVVLFNTQTGDYRFYCGGVFLTKSKGTVTIRGCIGTIDESKGAKRVHIEFDFSANFGRGKGTASLYLTGTGGPKCTILDQSMTGNACTFADTSPTVEK